MLSNRQTRKILFKQGKCLLDANRHLMIAPLCSHIISLALLASVIHPVIKYESTRHFINTHSPAKLALAYLILLLLILIRNFFSFFFMAITTHQAMKALQHAHINFTTAVKYALKNASRLYRWFFFSSCIGIYFVMFPYILNKIKWCATLTKNLRWGHISRFSIHNILTTKLSTFDTIRLTSKQLSETWGAPLRQNYRTNLYEAPFILIACAPLLISLVTKNPFYTYTGIGTSAILLTVISSYFSAIRIIIICACYCHASNINIEPLFNHNALANSYVVPDND